MRSRSAGILVPVFSLWTRDSLGRGEIPDLAPMIDFALEMGHRMIQLLPLDEGGPYETSPYSAMSVLAIDPMYIAALELAGVGRFSRWRARSRVGDARIVPRQTIRPVKLALLERAYRAARGATLAEFDKFGERNRDWLEDYGLFRALKERFTWSSWETWPPEIRSRDRYALAAARTDMAEQIRMYSFWQYLADRQWREIREHAHGRGVALGGDIAFSPSRDSAEVWANQEVFDLSRTVGAPPDSFNLKGQRWGLPLPRWDAMRNEGFTFLRRRVRRAASLYDLIRVDHVVGMYRTFSFPHAENGTGADADETPGAFVPERESEQIEQGEAVMRAILESAAPAEIVAEDLGTVPPYVRKSLATLDVPGYKVMQWEREWGVGDERVLSPGEYAEQSLATTGTHDTEPLAQWWRELVEPERGKLLKALGLAQQIRSNGALSEQDLDSLLTALYAAPSRLVVMPIQDLFGWDERINVPGTIAETNWSWRLPQPIEALRRDKAICARVARLREIAIASKRFK